MYFLPALRMKLSMAAKKLNKVCQSDKAADIFL